MAEKRRKVGLAFQLWIVTWLQERGWVCQNFTPTSQRRIIKGKEVWISKMNDPFGCVDIIGKKDEHRTLWIQATLHKSLKEKIKKMELVPWTPYADAPQIWIKRQTTGIIDIYQKDFGVFELFGKIIQRKFYKSEGNKSKEETL